jgi:hypothetical protein
MHKLQVEELEPRQLLNSAGFSPRPPSPEHSAAGPCPAVAAERAPFVDLRGHAGPAAADAPHEGGSEIRSPRSEARPYTGGGGQWAANPHESVPQSPGGTWSQQPVVPVAGGTAEPPAAAAEAAPEPGGARAPAAASGTNPAAAETVPALPAQGPSPQPSRPETPAEVSAVRPEVQGLLAVRSLSPSVRVGEGVSGTTEALLRHVPFLPGFPPSGGDGVAVPLVPAADGERAEEHAVVRAPQVSGVLAALPPPALSALERGLQQFLGQLERVGRDLTGDRPESGLWPWVVAGAAAITACEIARRQLRSSLHGVGHERAPG